MGWIEGAGHHGRRLVLVVVGLAVLGGLLSACYLPDAFKAEIRIAGDGKYVMTYEGILTWAPLYGQIAKGEVKGKEIDEKVLGIENDLRRDDSFTFVRSLGKGRFQVSYKREGIIDQSDLVTFIRRNAVILYMKAKPDGTVVIAAQTPKGDHQTQMQNLGLSANGILHVVTAMPSVENNAHKIVQQGAFRSYQWQVSSAMKQGPKLVVRYR